MQLDDLHLTDLGTAELRWSTPEGFHRETRHPGDDLADLPAEVRGQIEAAWTPEVLAAWSAANPPPPPVTHAECLQAQLAELADIRWRATQIFVFDGVWTQADPAIAVVSATLQMRRRRGVPAEATQTWKLTAVDFRQWGEAEIEAFGFAIADHIQACFDREADLTGQLLVAETVADLVAIDLQAGWPA